MTLADTVLPVKAKCLEIAQRTAQEHEPTVFHKLYLMGHFFERNASKYSGVPDVSDCGLHIGDGRVHFLVRRISKREDVKFHALTLQLENFVENECLRKFGKGLQQIRDFHSGP